MLIQVFPNSASIAIQLQKHLLASSKASIEQYGNFVLAVAGGSLIDILGLMAWDEFEEKDLEKWHVFMVDERYVPIDHVDSNCGQLLKKVRSCADKASKMNIHRVQTDLPIEECARDYTQRLEQVFRNDGCIDAVVLGMGPDGHIASIFPSQPVPTEACRYASVTNAPKAPAQRITLTIASINKAQQRIIVAMGTSKAEVIRKAIIERDNMLPVATVRDPIWLLDTCAASLLSFSHHDDHDNSGD